MQLRQATEAQESIKNANMFDHVRQRLGSRFVF